jgi:hypothetical protein
MQSYAMRQPELERRPSLTPERPIANGSLPASRRTRALRMPRQAVDPMRPARIETFETAVTESR